jgi:hypothetical protein
MSAESAERWQYDLARVMAAAPDLLEALVTARAVLAAYVGLPVDRCFGGDFVQINAAIAKATGQS